MKLITDLKLKYYTQKLNSEMKKKINSALPLGSIIPFAGNTAPSTYLLCDGSEVGRTDYADLFNFIGTNYGEGDGSTTFNLPDFTGRIPLGVDPSDINYNKLGMKCGERDHILTTGEMPKHIHNVYGFPEVGGGDSYGFTQSQLTGYGTPNTGGTSNSLYLGQTNAVGGSAAHNNIQPSLVVNYIIKAKYDVQTIQDLNIYSLDEQRIGTYYNGKPLYRKVYIGYITHNVAMTVDSIENVDEMIKLEGTLSGTKNDEVVKDSNYLIRPLNYYGDSSNHSSLFYDKQAKTLTISTSNSLWHAGKYFIMLEYTKTTD